MKRTLLVMGTVAGLLFADVVEMKNGDRVSGKIVKIHGGVVTLSTDYAGDLAIKQENVLRMSTDEEILARASTNKTDVAVAAKLDYTAGTNQTITTAFRNGDSDPDVPPPPKYWAYSAGLNLTGKSGNTEAFAAGLVGDAVYSRENVLFKIYGRYDYEKVEGELNTKILNFGADYEHRFKEKHAWYLRDDNIQNEMQNVKWRSYTAAGYSYYVWRRMDDAGASIQDVLRLRLGLGYAYDLYYMDEFGNEDVDSENTSIDAGLWFRQKMWQGAFWNTEITIEPSLNDTEYVFARHESRMEFEYLFKGIKQELGILNEYLSKPEGDSERLDTIWFIRLRAIW